MTDEEIANIEKVKAETALLNTQVFAAVTQQRLQERHTRLWYLPSPTVVIQAVVAGAILAGAFFFLMDPILEARRAITTKEASLAALEAKAAAARAEVQQHEIEMLRRRNADESEQLIRDFQEVTSQLKSVQQERDQFQKLGDALKIQIQDLQEQYEELAARTEATSSERDRFSLLAASTRREAESLNSKIAELEELQQTTSASIEDVVNRIELARGPTVDKTAMELANVVVVTDQPEFGLRALSELQRLGFTNPTNRISNSPGDCYCIKYGPISDQIIGQIEDFGKNLMSSDRDFELREIYSGNDRDIYIFCSILKSSACHYESARRVGLSARIA